MIIIFKSNKTLSVVILSILMVVVIPVSYGNSAEPPSILIIVPDAPDDLEIGIWSDGTYNKANMSDKIIEKYYTFYLHALKNTNNYKLKIDTDDGTFEILLNNRLKSYNNIFMLDLTKRTLTSGKSLSRTITLVSLRVILTLLIEGAIFWLFGYRQKKSWAIFLVINLLTQGLLNIQINELAPLASYIILTLMFWEILILIVEMIAFSTLVREHRRIETVLYVLTANVSSLIVGGYVILVLPI